MKNPSNFAWLDDVQKKERRPNPISNFFFFVPRRWRIKKESGKVAAVQFAGRNFCESESEGRNILAWDDCVTTIKVTHDLRKERDLTSERVTRHFLRSTGGWRDIFAWKMRAISSILDEHRLIISSQGLNIRKKWGYEKLNDCYNCNQ